MITGLNHITIAVSDLQQSINFYMDVLGFTGHVKWETGAYLSVGELWFCLSCDTPSANTDYTHIAFTVSDANFSGYCQKVLAAGTKQWKQNTSEGNSLYILDPDGHKLELHAGNLKSRLDALKVQPYKQLEWL
ncbi:fosfomycin resistance glutathione transferase [Pseudoalteromonas rubra]|uniref:Fosfomycin resistance glutathione transferase n=1 Tax=Pseudoalteromonas rubra TaxID=43658 RepID=A0A5S3X3Q4_9GAMM|nr:fosfomycin resistance glutathione transferase [Pseudoalteromonas rubra]TMP38431.1 fosfomycin resistance glutathione transferase [Pseudoalteromonas rubra]